MTLVHGWRWNEADRRRLVGLCARLTGDRQAAEDLAQETLLEAWRNGDKLRDPAGADRWLAAIARNVCLRWARTRGRERQLWLVSAESAEGDAQQPPRAHRRPRRRGRPARSHWARCSCCGRRAVVPRRRAARRPRRSAEGAAPRRACLRLARLARRGAPRARDRRLALLFGVLGLMTFGGTMLDR